MKKYIPNYLSEQSDDDLRRVLNNTYLTIRYWMLTIRDPSIVDKTNSGRCGDINMHLPGKLYDAAGIPVCFRITQKSHEATLIPPNSYFEKRAAFDRVIEEIEAAKAAKDEAKFKELRAQKLKLSKYLQSWGDIHREFTEVDFDGFPDEWKGAVVLDGWRKQAYTLEEWMKGNADKPPYSMMKYYDYLEKK